MFAEQVMHKLRGVVVCREVRKHQEAHERRPVGGKEFQRLKVRQVPFVDQHGFTLIANIIAIAVASGIQRGDVE
jgi:hypothetical protein